ncbi:MAG: TraB/GumN family protein [Arenimonas sp.]|uniref:TraB/GumN family protein n=1 Tax=Arenimonas sp. TaxID=1872635 RepID=UPI0025C34757|nr:TraB/GumN family protein [Arenimonas sp.]MBW8368776.1 TraB/GumN family protein [Arenimonas sp.]
MPSNARLRVVAHLIGAALIGLAPIASASAQTPAAQPDVVLDELVVTGVQPGPGLWRAMAKDGEGEVWILASLVPLPRAMQWQTAQVESILDTAAEVIAPPGVQADISAGDMLKMASLARAANAATKLPKRRRLDDVLPPEQYARWRQLRERHFPGDARLDRHRPLFASEELFYEAIRDVGLTRADIAWTRVAELAGQRSLRVVDTTLRYPLAIDRKAYRAGIRAVAESQVDDVGCFITTMDTLDASLVHFTRAANAWATGDMPLLLPMELATPTPPCKPVHDRAMSFQQRPGLRLQSLALWRSAVENALAEKRIALALLPLPDLVAPGGVLDQLRAAGFEVESPE